MAGFDVASILDGLRNVNSGLTQDAAAVAETSDNIADLNRQKSELATTNAQDKYLEVLTAQQGELAAQQRNALSMGQLKVDEIMAQLAPRLSATYETLQKQDAEITRKENISFWDNPFEFIAAQSTLDQDINTRNQTAANLNNDANMIKTVNDLAQESAATTLANKQTLTQASIEATARLASSAFKDKALDAKITAGAVDLNKIDMLAKINDRQLDNIIKGRQVLISEEQLGMQRASFAAEQNERKIRLAEFQKAKAKEGKEEEADLKMVEIYNIGARTLGKRPLQNVEEFKLMTRTPASKAMAEQLLDVGYQQMENKNPRIGATPADSANLLYSINGRLAPTQKKLETLLGSAVTQIKSGKVAGTGGQPLDLKNPVAVKDAMNRQVEATVKSFKRNVMEGKDNIYAPPSINSVVETIPVIKNDPFFKKVIAPELAALGTKELDPQYLLQRAAKAVLNKEVTYVQALAGVDKLIQGAVETNNATVNYESVGLPMQDSLRTKIVTAPQNRFSRGEQDIDLTKRAELGLVFNKLLTNDLVVKKFGGGAPAMFAPTSDLVGVDVNANPSPNMNTVVPNQIIQANERIK